MEERPALPIDDHLPAIAAQLATERKLIIEAAPGAGKSTRVPGALLNAPWRDGQRVVMLEPRRIAARNLAAFLARQRGEAIGDTVGLQIRDERRIGANTQLEIVTEGILTRRLQGDPELSGIGVLIFDEFHERHLTTDLGLALALEAQQLREDLRIVIMSATLDVERAQRWLGAAAIRCPGRTHPVQTEYLGQPSRRELVPAIAAAVRHAVGQEAHGILVFLPGVGEIERCQAAIEPPPGWDCTMLHGSLPLAAQARALESVAGQRRIVLSTNLAESSLTVPDIDCVIDSGLERAPRFDPGRGLTALITRQIDRESADQRRGRAGRTGPGRCLRMWSADARLHPRRRPEIEALDLSGLLLEVRCWGAQPGDLQWFDAPPDGALAQAADALQALGALDDTGQLTALGRRLPRWGCEPRLAAILESAGEDGALAADLVALLEARPSRDASDDLARRLNAVPRQASSRWRRRMGVSVRNRTDASACGRVLVRGFADRVARRRGDTDRYLTVDGRGLVLSEQSDLIGQAWIIATDVALRDGDSLLRSGVVLDQSAAADLIAQRGRWTESVAWSRAEQRVLARRVHRLGAIELAEADLADPDPEAVLDALLAGLREFAIDGLRPGRRFELMRARVASLRAVDPSWPDVSDAALTSELDDWLGPFLDGARSLAQVRALDLVEPLKGRIGWNRIAELDRLAPTHIAAPSGRRVALEYGGNGPVLAIKLQEMFGCTSTPTIADGRLPVTLHLLSPAGRPLQVTRDLASFWANGYHEVRKDMRGRYPKHPWPEDPLSAAPTARTKRALQRSS